MKTRTWLALVLMTVAAGSATSAASRYDPALRFRTLATPHFLIYFHQREDAVARRLAVLAEQVHEDLTARLKTAPRGRTHVILVDQNDLSNGWANPTLYDVIEITITPPPLLTVVGNVDDWLRLAFVHEYTHILHLDQSRGVASLARAVFGHSPLAFPNLFLPTWQIEGLATYEESAATGRGRITAGDFRLFVTEPARQGRPLPLDRASSDLDDWPDGHTPYAYGGFFNDYLARRFGEEKLFELSRATARHFYFLSSPAFTRVFGASLGQLWRDYQADAGTPDAGSSRAGRRLTSQGYFVAGPRFVRGSDRGARAPEILFSARTGDDFPAIETVDRDGRVRRVAARYLGEIADAAAGAAVFDQIDLARNVALRSDLHLLDLRSGRVDRLTTGGRAIDPAIAPDGRALACVTLGAEQVHLAVFDLPAGAWPGDLARLRAVLAARPRLELTEPGVQYFAPRWSPDGRWLAVSRRRRGGGTDIAVVDPATGRLRVVASSDRARLAAPAWTPDGATIVFASDRAGGPFNLYAVDVADPSRLYQVTDLPSGATYPDISPDGATIVYVGYTPAGYDLFLLPFDRSTWRETRPGLDSFSAPLVTAKIAADETRPGLDSVSATPYRPWRTLAPRYWLPAFDWSDEQMKIGAETSGYDVLGYHAYALTVLARIAGQPGAPGSRRYDWAAAYSYDRWFPTFFANASDRTHFLREVHSGAAVLPADLREQNGEVGVVLPDAHVRYRHALTASLNMQRQTINVGGTNLAPSNRNAFRLAWSLNSARQYAYSISPEQGATVGVTGEFVSQALGADASARSVTADVRSYLRLGGRHAILALRAAVGASAGDRRTSRVFFLGGPGPNPNPTGFGSDALNLLRGFDQNEFSGTRLAVVNAEYRVPLLRVQRGLGTWPVFLRTLHATAFLDTGKTWINSFSFVPFERSAGVELAANLRLGYHLPLTTALGVAWPHSPGIVSRPAAFYVRVGHAF